MNKKKINKKHIPNREEEFQHYFNFTQYYFMVFERSVPNNYEHCTKLWKRWRKKVQPAYKDILFQHLPNDDDTLEEMHEFLQKCADNPDWDDASLQAVEDFNRVLISNYINSKQSKHD